MGLKEPSLNQIELFEICKRGESEGLRGWLSSKRNRRPRTPLNFLRPSTPGTGWITLMKDPSSHYTALHLAALHGHEDVARLLIDADPHLTTAKDKRGCIPLHLAAWSGHSQLVKLLTDFEPESVDAINNSHDSPLHLSAQHGHVKVVAILLEKHSDARLRNVRCETPLDIAARCGHANVCKILVNYCPELALQSAAECNSPHKGENGMAKFMYPLHAAARHNHVLCMQMLRLAGFDIDYVTDEGSALHVAATHGQVEAVKFLLSEGINTQIKDLHGRTVLDTLEEHENDRSTDLTQIMPMKEQWRVIRALIEEHISSGRGTLNSSSDSGIDRRDDRTFSIASDTREREDVWRPLPPSAHAFNRTPSVHEKGSHYMERPIPTRFTLKDTSALGSPKDLHFNGGSLRGSRQAYGHSASPVSVNRTWNSKMLNELGERQVPRFPMTSPNTKSRHNTTNRISDTLPNKVGVLRTSTAPARGSILPGEGCVYRAPPSYEAYSTPVKKTVTENGSNRIIASHHQHLSYDNVPSRHTPPAPYDNAPSTASVRRCWDHNCSSPSSSLGGGTAKGVTFSPQKQPTRSDGTQTLPTGRAPAKSRPSVIGAFNVIEEVPPAPTPARSKLRQMMASREDSLGLSSSPVLTTRANSRSSTAFGFSTLERSISPMTASSRIVDGRAPLAMPEELSGSTTTSLMSSSASPDRHIPRYGNNVLDSPTQLISSMSANATIRSDTLSEKNKVDQQDSPYDTGAESISSQEDPPSPNTSESKIINCLRNAGQIGQNGSPPNDRMYSPCATECSESTVESSCSIPLNSNVSITPPSTSSPKREDKLIGIDGPTPDITVVMRNHAKRKEFDDEMDLDESAEWKKIDTILQTIGAGMNPATESPKHAPPQVACYVRDRHSKALTLQLTTPNNGTRWTTNSPERMNQQQLDDLQRWFTEMAYIDEANAASLSTLFFRNGFDRAEHLAYSLDKNVLVDMGIKEHLQRKILGTFELANAQGTTANDFNYVSDWLCSLDLKEYLSNFVKNGLKSMLLVKSTDIDEVKLNSIGVTKLGHVMRILGSLKAAEKEDQLMMSARAATMKREKSERSCSPNKSQRISNSELLITGWVNFSAHYLGSTEISNVNSTEESRAAMTRLKKAIREIAKVPQVRMEISVSGVRISDAISGRQTAFHEIYQIQIVCQDERDLNCFTYITRDNDRFLCHVFCVLTADVATEIVITLGQAFECAFQQQQTERTTC